MTRRAIAATCKKATFALSLCVITTAAAMATGAQAAGSGPAVPGYGSTHTAPAAAEHPVRSLRYRVLFNITQGSDDPGKPNVGLDKVARFMNLLAADGVRPQPGDVVAVIHGKATPVVLSPAASRARGDAVANPNLELIDLLRKAGVSVRVCSQALAAASIAPEAVDKRVQIDVAALTTMANLQLRGYALIPD